MAAMVAKRSRTRGKAAPRWDVGEGRLGRVLVVRLAPGDDLYESVKEVCRERGIKNGVILSAAASLHRCVLRNVWSVPDPFPITNENRRFTPVEGPLELLAMSGNISQTEDGEVYLHAHVTISLGRPEGVAMGGHLVPGAIIFSTGELVLAEVEGCKMVRVKDGHTRALELFGLTLDGLGEEAQRKALAARKARPRPAGTK